MKHSMTSLLSLAQPCVSAQHRACEHIVILHDVLWVVRSWLIARVRLPVLRVVVVHTFASDATERVESAHFALVPARRCLDRARIASSHARTAASNSAAIVGTMISDTWNSVPPASSCAHVNGCLLM